GDIEAENLLLFRQALRVGERRDVRKHVLHRRRAHPIVATEEGHLSGSALLLLERCLLQRAVENRCVLRAMPTEIIQRAGRDERLEHPLVAQTQVDALAEIEETPERALLRTRGEQGVDRRASNVANGAEAEAYALLGDHRELVA